MMVLCGSPIFGVCFCDTGMGVVHDDMAIKFWPCIRFPSHPPFPHSSYQVILHFKGFLLVVLVPQYSTGKVR